MVSALQSSDYSTVGASTTAQDEAECAENQLAAAEEYMCSLMHIIYSSGFTINFLDSHTPAVTKVTGNEHITRELCASVSSGNLGKSDLAI